ncbi:hypothetical protein HDU89_005882 [Geranomyces variabilis]|nr:hypothetical protein HDU89_005882 [Geranomyces variabilis]
MSHGRWHDDALSNVNLDGSWRRDPDRQAPPQSEVNRGPEGGRFGTQPILDSASGSAARRVERVRQHADEALRAVSATSQTGPLPPSRPRDAHVVAYQDNTTRRRAEVQAAALRDENPNSVAPLTISPVTWSGLPNYAPSPPRRRVDMRFKDPTNILNSLVLSEPSSPRGDARKIRSDIGSLPRYEPGEGTVSQWLASSALQPNTDGAFHFGGQGNGAPILYGPGGEVDAHRELLDRASKVTAAGSPAACDEHRYFWGRR